MGCGIHLWFEQKKPDGKWERIEIDERIEPDDREYRVFAFLANVRNYEEFRIEPQFENRGIPSDSLCRSGDYDDNFWLGDHGYTHVYLDELLNAPWKEVDLEECYFHVFCRYIIQRIIKRYYLSEEEKRNIRVIIGFDN